MTRNSHMHKNFKQDTYYINFVPQQKLFSSFFVGTVTRGKLLEENYKFRSTCMLKNYYFNSRDERKQ